MSPIFICTNRNIYEGKLIIETRDKTKSVKNHWHEEEVVSKP